MTFQFPRETFKIGGCICVEGWQEQKYKRLKYKKEHWPAHRLSYHLNVKEIPRSPQTSDRVWISEMVLHTCNHKWCINPEHLYLGRHKENGDDRWRDATYDQKSKHAASCAKFTSSDEYRAKMSVLKKGVKFSDGHREKMSIASRKRPPASLETRAKMSQSARNRKSKCV